MSRVLTLNAGSTSMKVAVVERGRVVSRPGSLEEAVRDGSPLSAVAHRVVQGGEREGPVLLDDAEVESLRGLSDLAPLHQPPALVAVDRARAAWPDVPQVACFDTTFHRSVPDAARTYALPEGMRHEVRRFGFHGLSHAWAVRRAAELAPAGRRVLVAHLGGGQSLCGTVDGASVWTTMGFTPADGLVMSTRSGDVDPSATAWLAARHDDLGTVLERRSGLLALCGEADMEQVLSRSARGDREAAFAVEVYRHRLVACLGATVAPMGGVDTVVLTGGVGENAPAVQAMVVDALAWLGASYDREATGEDRTADGSRVRVLVVHAQEDLQMAVEAEGLLGLR